MEEDTGVPLGSINGNDYTKLVETPEPKAPLIDNRFFEAMARVLPEYDVARLRNLCHDYVTQLEAKVAQLETQAVLSDKYWDYFFRLEAQLFEKPQYSHLTKGRDPNQKKPHYFTETSSNVTVKNLGKLTPALLLNELLSLSEDTPVRVALAKEIFDTLERRPLSRPTRFRELCKLEQTRQVLAAKHDYCKTKDALEHYLLGKSQKEMKDPRKPNRLTLLYYSTAYYEFFTAHYDEMWNLSKHDILERLLSDEEKYVELRQKLLIEIARLRKVEEIVDVREAFIWLLNDTQNREAIHFIRAFDMYEQHLKAQITTQKIVDALVDDENARLELSAEIRKALQEKDKKTKEIKLPEPKNEDKKDYEKFCSLYNKPGVSKAEQEELEENYYKSPSAVVFYSSPSVIRAYLSSGLSLSSIRLFAQQNPNLTYRVWKKSDDGKEINLESQRLGADAQSYESIDLLQTADIPPRFVLLTPASFQPLGSFRDFCHEQVTAANEKTNWIKAQLGEEGYQKYLTTVQTTHTGCPEIDGAILCEVLAEQGISLHVTQLGKNSLEEQSELFINQHGVITNLPDVENYCNDKTIRLHADHDGAYLQVLAARELDELFCNTEETNKFDYEITVDRRTKAVRLAKDDALKMNRNDALIGTANILKDDIDTEEVVLKVHDTAVITKVEVAPVKTKTKTLEEQEAEMHALAMETVVVRDPVQPWMTAVADGESEDLDGNDLDNDNNAERPAPPAYAPAPLPPKLRTLKAATPSGFFVSESAPTSRPPAPTTKPLPPETSTDNKGKEEADKKDPKPETPPEATQEKTKETKQGNNLYQAIADGLNNIIDGSYVPLRVTHSEESLRKLVDDYVSELPDKNWVETQLNLKGQYTFKEYVDNVRKDIPCDIDLETRIICEKLGDKKIHVVEVEERDVKDDSGVTEKHKVELKHYIYDKNGRREVKPEDVDWASGDIVSLVHDRNTGRYEPFKSYLPRTPKFKIIDGIVHVVMGLNLVVAITPQGAGAMVQAILNNWSTAGAVAIAYGSIVGKVALLYFYGFYKFGGFPSTYNKIALKLYNIADYLERFGIAIDEGTWEWRSDVAPLVGAFALSLIPALFFGALAKPSLDSFADTIHNNPAKFIGWDNLIWLADHAQTAAAYQVFFWTSFVGNMTSAMPILENIKRIIDKWIADAKNVYDKGAYEKIRFGMGTAAGLLISGAVWTGFYNFKDLAFKDIYGNMIQTGGIPGAVTGYILASTMFVFIEGLGFAAAMPFGRNVVESAFDTFFGDIQYKDGDFRKDNAQYQGFRSWWKSQPNLHKSFFVFAIGLAGATDFFGGYPNLFQASTLDHESNAMGVFALIASMITEFDGTKEVIDKICKAVEKLLKFVGMKFSDFYNWFLSKAGDMPYWKEYKIRLDQIKENMFPSTAAQYQGLFAYRDTPATEDESANEQQLEGGYQVFGRLGQVLNE